MYEHPFIVAKLTNEGILGTDFLKVYGDCIDFARKKVSLDGQAMAIGNGFPGNRVSLAEEVVIPAGAGHWKALAGVLTEGWCILGGKCVMVGRSLVEGGRGKVSVEIFNLSHEDVVLQKNTHAALMHPVEVD